LSPAYDDHVTTPIWDDLLTEDDRSELEPGVSEPLDDTPDVLIVGGGVIGLATAVFLRRAGIDRVLVIERERRLASAPSGRAAGTLTPGIHSLLQGDAFVRLAQRGLELHRELDEEWGGAAGFRTIDSLVAPPIELPADLPTPPGMRVVDGIAAREIEPEFGEVAQAIHIERQGAVPPLRFAAELARRAGAVATGVAMLDLEATPSGAARVRTSHGVIEPGSVVLTTGLSDRFPLRQRPVKGHMLATEPAPFTLRTLPAGLIGFVQTAEGRVIGGGTVDLGDDDPVVRPDVIDSMLADLGRLVPAAKQLRVTHTWTCFRPAVLDEIPVIDQVPGFTNVWASVAHFRTGIMVSPAAADLITRWITTGERPIETADFAGSRA
jgi:glycine/D-amino acid oxidase-like deaminating enzyme